MSKKLSAACFAALTLLAVCGFALRGKPAQTQAINDTVISIEKSQWTIEPAEIVGLHRNHEGLRPDVSFTGYDGWLRDLRVVVKNTSASTIRYIAVQVVFPERDENREIYLPIHQMHRGFNYSLSQTNFANVPELYLKSREQIALSFSDFNYERFAERAAKVPAKVLKNIRVRLHAVVFDDLQTGWFGDWYFKRNADRIWVQDERRVSL